MFEIVVMKYQNGSVPKKKLFIKEITIRPMVIKT
jgi:hypothetical protein